MRGRTRPRATDGSPGASSATWATLDAGLQSAFADPAFAGRELELHGQTYSIEAGINTFCTNDIFIHTWDPARATG